MARPCRLSMVGLGAVGSDARDAMNKMQQRLTEANRRNSDLEGALKSHRESLQAARDEREKLAATVRALASKLSTPRSVIMSANLDAGAGDVAAPDDFASEAKRWRTVSCEEEMRMLLADSLNRAVAAAISTDQHSVLEYQC